jgi:hypothetical protein
MLEPGEMCKRQIEEYRRCRDHVFTELAAPTGLGTLVIY